MNYNNYFKLFYYLIKNNLIEENTKIFPILKDKIILNKNIIKKEKNIEYFICEINLENNKTLLIEDLPINFLISHTILVGENTELYEFEIENNNKIRNENNKIKYNENKIYITTKEILDLLTNSNSEQNIIIKNKKQISSKELYNLRFKTNYEQPEILVQLKSYLSEYKKINFNKIHLTKTNLIENFTPTARATHLKLAKEMNIPTTNLIENNYIKNSNINIYDSKKIKEILNPIIICEKINIVKTCKKNKIVLYNDINTDFYIRIPTEEIISMIEKIKETNFDKDIIIKEILNKKIIKISGNHGKYYLPIWKSIQEQKYLEIKDIQEFEEFTGMIFKETTDNFKYLYLQYKGGERVICKNKYLKQKLTKLIEEIKENENIEFETIEELILKLIFNEKTNIKTISKIENYNENLISKIINNTNLILKYVILESIKNNIMPKKIEVNNNIENYLININNYITKLKTDFKNSGDKKTFINLVFEITCNLKIFIKTININPENYYSLIQIINSIILYLKPLSEDKIIELEEEFNNYFRKYKFTLDKYPIINFEIINLLNDILKTNLIKKEISIFIKNPNINKNYFKVKTFIETEPEYEKYIKPNYQLIKQLFKYNTKEIINQINEINLETVEIKELKINNQIIPIKKEYYTIYHKYKNYKTILENDYFKVLSPLQK